MQSVEWDSKPELRKSDIHQYFLCNVEVSCSQLSFQEVHSEHMIDRHLCSFVSSVTIKWISFMSDAGGLH
jgi:hypothetical protein